MPSPHGRRPAVSEQQLKPIRYYKRRLTDMELRDTYNFPDNNKVNAMESKHMYIVTWRSKHQAVRKKVIFNDEGVAKSFYQEKLAKGKSPSLYVTELVESTRQLK